MSKCINTAPVAVCFTAENGTKQSLVGHVLYEQGVAIGQAFTTADDTETIVDVTGGTITAGACPVFQPDVEFEQLCDVLADGTIVQFICRTITSFDANGDVVDPVATAYFELDKVTPYVIAGTVEKCNDECEPVGSMGTITAWAQLRATGGATEGGTEGGIKRV